ncbi:villin, putative [Entamoeba dispar SAW760]|uniref:Villin, putative n=1 Tax=Entamoeba dispar (strain ATCC PRA-260 / SAW760) TaxID=370354 RepID=B0EU68_ENTDS|nr:villin, putative [Entamoeba dispar SAW760]EDR21929.1 villin, putative [Entamoeba dispar SAW760]|eukprot:EDR21929.1 villin, putative [Entamoeba dispar SAW760]
MSDLTDLMKKFRERKGIDDATLAKNQEIKEITNRAKGVDAETDLERRKRERRERREREEREAAEKEKAGSSTSRAERVSTSAETAEEAREKRRLERQRQREEEKRRLAEEERKAQEEREARRKKREEELRIAEEQREAQRKKEREERRKRLEEERKALEGSSVTERTERAAQKLKQATLIGTKEVTKDSTETKQGNQNTLNNEQQTDEIRSGKQSIQLIELKANNEALRKQVEALTKEKEDFQKGAGNRQIELENKIKENIKEIELLKGDLELYRGKQKEKPLFHTKPSRNLEWPDELKMPVLKVGVKAIGITGSDDAYIGEITGDNGNKWQFTETLSVLKHKVFPSPEVMQETIDNLVMVNNNLKIRQQEMEKEHQRYVKGVENEMKQLRADYEKLRDVYGADVVKMHANINNRVSMVYGLECNMAVQVAEAIKDVKDYSKGKLRWYSTTSKNDDKLWADLKRENNEMINYPKGRHDFKARLFQFYTSEDNELLCNELRSYKQEDLTHGKAFILDTFNEVFVYYGTGCPKEDRAKVTSAALAYNKYSDDGRSVNTPVIQVENGQEPVRFRLQFKGWDQRKIVDRETQQNIFTDNGKYFGYAQLLNSDKLPDWVDRSCLEEYLKDDEFKGVFRMERSEFNMLPRWKKDAERRKAKLF